jgi:hypothetical protein
MAITTLLSVLLVGGAAVKAQAPTILQIHTKCYAVTGKAFKMTGKKFTSKPISGGSVTRFEGFDEEKVAKQDGVKLVTAPVVRTVDGRQASLTQTWASKDSSTQFTLAYLPTMLSDGKINLEVKFAETLGPEKTETWSFVANAVMGKESQAWIVTRNNTTSLYIINASIIDPGRR